MASGTVLITRRCNQNCHFCTQRAEADPEGFDSDERIIGEIRRIRNQGAARLTLTGGEPTLDPRLTGYLRIARTLGFRDVVLETNGLHLASVEFCKRLLRAGLARARISANAIGPVSDGITRDPGGWRDTRQAMLNFASLGQPVELSIALTRMNLDHLAGFPDRLFADLGPGAGPVERIVLRHVSTLPSDADPALAVSQSDAAGPVMEFLRACAPLGLRVHIDPFHLLVPCVFDKPADYLEQIEWGPEGFAPPPGNEWARIPACDACVLRPYCPGPPRRYVERFGIGEFRTLRPDDVPDLPTILAGTAHRMRREFAEYTVVKTPDAARDRLVLRINFHCNQDCGFCFVTRTLPEPPQRWITDKIREGARRNITQIVFSGGEPTLNPRLLEYISMARDLGIPGIEIQTNALPLGKPGFATTLREAGLQRAFVSLHGATAAVSDAVTRAPNTFRKTLAGIDALLAESIVVCINFVICRLNFTELPAFSRLIRDQYGNRVYVNFSFVAANSDVVPVSRELIPRFSDVKDHLDESLRLLREGGVLAMGLDSMCGVPFCFAGIDGYRDDPSAFTPLPDGASNGECVKTPACDTCLLNAACYGVRRNYASLYGLEEVTPFTSLPPWIAAKLQPTIG